MSWHQQKVKETPSKSVNPRKRRYQATIYNSLPSGTPLPHYNTQKNHTEPSYNNHPQHRTLEECWGLPKPQIDHFNKIPDAFGHSYDSKELDSFRCITHNINNIPSTAYWPKSKIITKMAQGADQADIRLWQETGIYWPKIKPCDRWRNRLRGFSQGIASNFSFNQLEHEITGVHQPGGTAVISNYRLTSRKNNQGKDPSGLGRWSWMSFGDDGRTQTTFFSAYRPCVASSGGGTATYDQHLRHLSPSQEPREQILEDLKAEVKSFIDKGHNIIIGMDANEDIQGARMTRFMDSLNLHDVVSVMHGRKCPSTTTKSLTAKPIDILMCSLHIMPVASGITFDRGSPSDHALVWADFKKEDLFGEEFREFKTFVNHLNADDPRHTRKYNDLTLNRIAKENIEKELDRLNLIGPGSFTHEDICAYNDLLNRITQIRQSVAKSLRRVFRGQRDWSPEWDLAKKTKALWVLLDKKHKIKQGKVKGTTSMSQIRRLMKATGNRDALTYSADEVEKEVKRAKANYITACKEAPHLRETFKESLDEANANKNRTTIACEKKKRVTIEKQREAAKAVSILRRKMRPKVSKVFATVDNRRIEFNTKEQIEKACINENIKRFSQSQNTPPMDLRVTEKFGFYAEKEGVEGILEGFESLEEIEDHYLKMVLEAMRRPEIVTREGLLTGTITLEEHCKAWKKQRRRTSSERSQLNFNDFKAAAHNKRLASCDMKLRQIPYTHGFAPEPHKMFTDFQILKKAKVFEVEKMRTIQLMPAAFNMNNKKTGREVMFNAEKFKLIPDEQAGSRKNHRSILTALNKVLCIDLARARKIPTIIVFNDAKSCYDRIVLWIAAISLRRMGVSKGATLEMLKTLQTASHKICTAYGDSSISYDADRNIPLQGVGQGNGAGPAIWVAISSVLLTIMRSKGFGFSILSALSWQALAIAAFAFVDDTDIIHSATDPYVEPSQVLSEAQRAVTTWEGILGATGGAIGANDDGKAFWYFLDYQFVKKKWKYKSSAELSGQLWVKNFDGRILPITRLEPDEARETLGIMIAMDGNQNAQFINLRKKAKIYGEQLRTGFIDRHHAWYSYTSVFSKTLEYPMEAINLSKEQWDLILKEFMGHLLNKSGIVSSMSRDLVFSSKRYNGLGIKHPFYLQHIKHIAVLWGTNSLNCQSRALIEVAWEEACYECGWGNNLMDAPKEILELITEGWLKQTILFMKEHKISIVREMPESPKCRNNDSSIMKHLNNVCNNKTTLQELNQCRLYLKVFRVSDLTTAQGSEILFSNNRQVIANRYINCPNYRKVPEYDQLDWKLWDFYLQLSGIARGKSLLIELGPWRQLSISDHWKWRFSHQQDRVWSKHQNIWVVYARARPRKRTRAVSGTFIKIGFSDEHPPNDLVRADVIRREEGIFLQTATSIDPVGGTNKEVRKDFIWEEWSNECIISDTTREEKIKKAIEKGTALAVSDGSFKKNRGTAAAIVEDSGDPTSRAIIMNRVPGERKIHSPFRAELAGVIGIITFVVRIQERYKMKKGRLRIGLDGEAVIKVLNGHRSNYPKAKCFDLFQYLNMLVEKSTVTFSFFWIKGHQDDLRNEEISYEGTLNIICDDLAKAYWNETRTFEGNFAPKKVCNMGWHLKIGEAFQSRLDIEQLYDVLFGQLKSVPYSEARIPLDYGSPIDINWDAVAKAMKSITLSESHWMAKFISGTAPTGKVMARRREWDSPNCPICFKRVEDSDHVITCRNKAVKSQWRKAVNELICTLEEKDTEPNICMIIKDRLIAWQEGDRMDKFPYVEMPLETRIAMETQDRLGWRPFILGRTAEQWQLAQEKWILRQHTRWKASSRAWAGNLVLLLFRLIRSMWEHRNSILHNPNHKWLVDKRKNWDNVIQQIFDSYDPDHWLPGDRRFFVKKLKTVLEYTDEAKRQWIESVKKARLRFLNDG